MNKIVVSVPCKVHLLGEWAVVWGKPAILTTVDLRITVTITPSRHPEFISGSQKKMSKQVRHDDLQQIIEPIVKKELNLKKIPPYELEITSEIPIGTHLGSSAAISVSYISALLYFLKIKWDLELINKLAYEAEKALQGNPSGADNSTIVYGGLIWFRKESEELKIIQKLPFSIPNKLAKNFVLINTGIPKLTTKQMIEKLSVKIKNQKSKFKKIFDDQERLVKELLPAIKNADEKEFIRIIRAGEKNLETIGVCSPEVKKIIRSIENAGGAAKTCGAGAFSGPTGVLLAFHENPKVLEKIAKQNNLSFFKTKLGIEGLRKEE